MRNLLVFITMALFLFAADNPNQLTKAEISEGWLLLYDGESAFGWSPEGGAEWSTDPDGNLTAKSGDSGDMLLNTTFGEYQISCEMRALSAKGSGLVLNGTMIPPPKPNDKWHVYTATLSGGHLV